MGVANHQQERFHQIWSIQVCVTISDGLREASMGRSLAWERLENNTHTSPNLVEVIIGQLKPFQNVDELPWSGCPCRFNAEEDKDTRGAAAFAGHVKC